MKQSSLHTCMNTATCQWLNVHFDCEWFAVSLLTVESVHVSQFVDEAWSVRLQLMMMMAVLVSCSVMMVPYLVEVKVVECE